MSVLHEDIVRALNAPDLREQVAAQGADAAELARLGPPRHGLGIHPKQGGDLRGRQELVGLGGCGAHGTSS
jgi:hypothetical protein